MTRADLQAAGYLSMYAQADLHRYGWQIRHWMHPTTLDHVIEYIPRVPGQVADFEPTEGAVIARDYAEQVAFHRSIGVAVVPPGERWTDRGEGVDQPWLF